jgi:hypothetical protein
LLVVDAGWIGAVASIIALATTLVIYLITRKKKLLTYEVVSEYALMSIDNEIRGKLQILLNGKPVEDVHLLSIKFINQGNVPIAASDYEKPLTITFTGSSQILSSEYLSASPASLAPQQTIQEQRITFEPILLNGGDYFSTKILLGEYSGAFDIDARILGVKSIDRATNKRAKAQLSNPLVYVSIMLVILGVGYLVYKLAQDLERPLVITSINASQYVLSPGDIVQLTAFTNGDCNGDVEYSKTLNYHWTALNGHIFPAPNGRQAEYQASYGTGPQMIFLTITTKFGQTATSSTGVVIDYRTYRSNSQHIE